MKGKKEKVEEDKARVPRAYFFFAAGFFSSFFGAGFLATSLTSGF
jgi:hypothetical protein